MKKTSMPAAPATTGQGQIDPALGHKEAMTAEAATVPTSEVPVLYIGKQQDLYLYSLLGWRHYLAHQAAFGAFSPMYTVRFGEDQLAFIALTKAMPDQDARAVEPMDAKDDLLALNQSVLDKFFDGRLYIERTYPDPARQKTMLGAAGDNYYQRALNRNWSSTEGLIMAFKRFLALYGPELLASNQMPEGFPKDFDAVSGPFLELWQSYKDKWDNARQERSLKAENNNLIYKALSEMCEVGRRKFADKPEVKKKFTLTALLNEVSGHSPSGLRGLCAIGGVKRYPVANARISTTVGGEVRLAMTDAAGRYLLLLPSGNYALLVEAEGFAPQTLRKTVKIGIKSYLNVALERVPAPVAAAVQQHVIKDVKSVNLTDMVEDVMGKVGNGAH